MNLIREPDSRALFSRCHFLNPRCLRVLWWVAWKHLFQSLYVGRLVDQSIPLYPAVWGYFVESLENIYKYLCWMVGRSVYPSIPCCLKVLWWVAWKQLGLSFHVGRLDDLSIGLFPIDCYDMFSIQVRWLRSTAWPTTNLFPIANKNGAMRCPIDAASFNTRW